MAQTHNPVEKAAGLTVYYPVVPAYQVRENKEVEEVMKLLEPVYYDDRYGINAA